MNSQHKTAQLTASRTFEANLTAFFDCAIKTDTPIAIWRKPTEELIQGCCQVSDSELNIEDLENAPQGFMVSPFAPSDEPRPNYILSDISINEKDNAFKIHPTLQHQDQSLETFFEAYLETKEQQSFDFRDYLHKAPEVRYDRQAFIDLVQQCQDAINNGQYQKIVPSRRERYSYSNNFHPVKELFKLCKAYKNAFVSIVYTPQYGLWLGATPELLIETQNEIFRTVSLAGTQGVPDDFELSRAAWRQKEIEEQALVSRYIINCFKKIRLREYLEIGPKTVKAGNLIHLKTSFEVNMKETNFPELASTMLQLLHPTSAVCGMPMIPAANFLAEHEGYDRECFSGYLGPVNHGDTTSLYVNLRCTKLYKDGGIIYAGAGVTEESIPELEWNETEIKFRTLLNIFENL
ncbi:chorismate-binding protein [Reichenbachiella sp. MSK19-1]|uniref:chorismate-binding protein n=1 Tax=Reichenbachiella sp. MSK19-1 TaxID=1897631 RepID=UPI000E6C6BC3|nr:chorismate-binding protein [Reichenbachiella sp. MSK19-1]RJE74686.1 hypothetical protein BGP76_16255 [Reichenbachiella sp. MSK19-1]